MQKLSQNSSNMKIKLVQGITHTTPLQMPKYNTLTPKNLIQMIRARDSMKQVNQQRDFSTAWHKCSKRVERNTSLAMPSYQHTSCHCQAILPASTVLHKTIRRKCKECPYLILTLILLEIAVLIVLRLCVNEFVIYDLSFIFFIFITIYKLIPLCLLLKYHKY